MSGVGPLLRHCSALGRRSLYGYSGNGLSPIPRSTPMPPRGGLAHSSLSRAFVGALKGLGLLVYAVLWLLAGLLGIFLIPVLLLWAFFLLVSILCRLARTLWGLPWRDGVA